ncbi:MAG: CHAT domain-containing protein [bacterium]|nr:CHAT domain-containing protein [bacterium]
MIRTASHFLKVMSAGLILLVLIDESAADQRLNWFAALQRADSLRKGADYDRAIEICETISRELGAQALARDTLAAFALQVLGDCMRRRADLDAAKMYIDESYEIYSVLLPVNDPRLARNLNSLGVIAQSDGDLLEAERLYRDALTIRLAAYGDEHPDVAQSLSNLGAIQMSLGNFTDADRLYREALRTNECTIGPDHPDCAFALTGIAMASERLGRYSEAATRYMEAVDLRHRMLGPDHPDVAQTKLNLAVFLMNQGNNTQALRYAREACDAYRISSGPDHPAFASALNNLAIIYQEMGRFDESLPILEEAERIDSAAGVVAIADRIAVNSNIANVALWKGDLNEAERRYRACLRIAEDHETESEETYAICLANLGILLRNNGRCAEADSLYRRALELMEVYYEPDQLECTKLRTLIAETIICRGLCAEAANELATVQRDLKNTVGSQHPDYAIAVSLLACAQEQCGEYGVAVENARAAWRIRVKMLNDLLPVLAEKNALDYSEEFLSESSNLLSVLINCREHGVDVESYLSEVTISSKGRVTEGLLRRRSERATSTDPTVQALHDSLNMTRTEMSNHYVWGADDDSESFDLQLATLTTLKRRLEQDLAEKLGTSDYSTVDTLDVEMIAKALPERTVLIDYVRYDHRTVGLETEPRYLALLVSRSETAVFELGAAASIDTMVQSYRRHMNRDLGLDFGEFIGLARRLHTALWKPFADRCDAAELVIVAPDAALHFVSFGSLVDDYGRYLIEKYPLRYCGTARELLNMEREPTQTGTGLLAVGDVDYDFIDTREQVDVAASEQLIGDAVWDFSLSRGPVMSCDHGTRLFAVPLHATRDEVMAVAGFWSKTIQEPVTVLLKTEATESSFKDNCVGKRVLHLATHGFTFANSCARTVKPRTLNRTPVNPLLLSGLLLAGCNQALANKDSSQQEDGVLTAEEIAGLDLRGTELVVLSACESGLGEIQPSEGLFGPTRAFRMAGAQNVVSALWRVDDLTTALMMQEIMEREDAPIENALREAMLGIIDSLRADGRGDHPYYWAGFTICGGVFDRE